MGCMETHPQPTGTGSEPAAWRLTEALDAKLAELKALGLEVHWIESSHADLTRLIIEGGEAAVRLDPDPAVDRAWYGDVEIRHTSSRELTWVLVRAETDSEEVSAHVVSPPDRPPTVA
jgi:hypothetical protein